MCEHIGCQCNIFSMDSKTPLNLHLTAYYKRSFAFHTVKDRLPVILTKTIDYLVRDKENIVKFFGEQAKEELKYVIGELSKLKYEIQTNKPLTKFNSSLPNTEIYDWLISQRSNKDGDPKYFTTVWLLVEAYMYRRIIFIFENTENLTKFDPFRSQKKQQFYTSEIAITGLLQYMIHILKTGKVDPADELINLLKINLWGNKCDLSISAMSTVYNRVNPVEVIEPYEKYILCNHSQDIYNCLLDEEIESTVVEMVNDNAGYEMITDFCLADFLITHGFCKKVVFNLKQIPWFVSDVTILDFRWLIRRMINNENANFKKFGIRWNKYIREKTWIIETDPFWTTPLDFTYMEEKAPHLYNRLGEAKLVIFKGDLNYRKLFGEKNWEPSTPVPVASQNFAPTRWCVLRTLKSDIICGLPKGLADELDVLEPSWLVSGDFGVIQFSETDQTEYAD